MLLIDRSDSRLESASKQKNGAPQRFCARRASEAAAAPQCFGAERGKKGGGDFKRLLPLVLQRPRL